MNALDSPEPTPHSSAAGAMSTFICEDHDGVTVARVACEVVREHQSAVMRDQLRALAGRNGGRLVIGLERVTGLSSSFFCELAWVRERCSRLGGRLVLYGAGPRVRDAIRAVGGGIDLASTREEAVLRCAAAKSAHGEQGSILGWLRRPRAA